MTSILARAGDTMAIRLGPFELEEPVGKGGMGEVWRAAHRTQQVPVAVKVLTREGARKDSYLEAFRTEVRAIARLHHPGVIVVLDYGRISAEASRVSRGRLVEGSPYIAMELARYGSLDEYRLSMRWPELRAVLLTTLDALAHAHARGVIHRDLKPQNILLGCGEHDAVKLTDFGLAHAAHEELERADDFGAGWGTPAYMAPEQFRGLWREYGPWTDLYALGCMAYELATGRVPYQEESKWGMGRAHIMYEIPRLFTEFEVPSGFEGWVLRLLQKEPRRRFQRAADAARALVEMGEPAGPISSRELFTDRFGAVDSSLVPEEPADEADINPTVLFASGELTEMIARRADDDSASEGDESGGALTELLDSGELGVPTQVFESGELGGPGRESLAALPALRHTGAGGAIEPTPSDPTGVDEEGLELGRVPERTHEDIVVPTPSRPPPVPLTWRRRLRHPPSLRLLGAGLGLYGMRQARFIGREAERDLLWQVLREVHTQRSPRGVLVRGPAGVGKTRLASWFVTRAHELGSAVVLRATHDSRRTPFDGLGPMLVRHLRCAGLERADALERVRQHLEAQHVEDEREWELVAEIVAPPKQATGEPELDTKAGTSRFHTHDQRHAVLARLLRREARERVVIVWLDDVQWGAEALMFARRLLNPEGPAQGAPILVLMTLREEGLEEGSLEEMILEQVQATGRCYPCQLGALEDDEFAAFVHEVLTLEPELAARIRERARGVPLFAEQIIGKLVGEGRLEVGEGGFTLRPGERIELPDDIHQLWKQRLEQLLEGRGAEQRQCLEIASALGVEISFPEWLNACRHHSLRIDRALMDGLFEAGLLEPTEEGWAFAHGMLRESLERQAREAGRWAGLNRACAEMLLSIYSPSHPGYHARYARHLIEAGELGRALAPQLEAARRCVERSDLDGALGLLDERDELLEQLALPASDARRARGDLLRAHVLDQQGRYLDAKRWAQGVLERALSFGWAEDYLDAAIQCGYATLHRGDTEEAAKLFGEVLGRLGAPGSAPSRRQALRATIGLGRVAQRRGDLGAARARFERALEWARELKDPLARATCLNGLGDVARQGGELERAQRLALRALGITEELGNHILIADCYNDLSEISRIEGDFARAADRAARAAELYESVGSDQSLRARRNLGFIALCQRDFEAAWSTFEALRERLGRTHDYGELSMVLAGRMPCLAARGRWEELTQALERAIHLLAQTERCDADIQFACRLAARIAQGAGREALGGQLEELGQRHAPAPEVG